MYMSFRTRRCTHTHTYTVSGVLARRLSLHLGRPAPIGDSVAHPAALSDPLVGQVDKQVVDKGHVEGDAGVGGGDVALRWVFKD